jgi:hypothetical protein
LRLNIYLLKPLPKIARHIHREDCGTNSPFRHRRSSEMNECPYLNKRF